MLCNMQMIGRLSGSGGVAVIGSAKTRKEGGVTRGSQENECPETPAANKLNVIKELGRVTESAIRHPEVR